MFPTSTSRGEHIVAGSGRKWGEPGYGKHKIVVSRFSRNLKERSICDLNQMDAASGYYTAGDPVLVYERFTRAA
jgi:hypothetical protein